MLGAGAAAQRTAYASHPGAAVRLSAGGLGVYPAEIEPASQAHRSVREAAAFARRQGQPDDGPAATVALYAQARATICRGTAVSPWAPVIRAICEASMP